MLFGPLAVCHCVRRPLSVGHNFVSSRCCSSSAALCPPNTRPESHTPHPFNLYTHRNLHTYSHTPPPPPPPLTPNAQDKLPTCPHIEDGTYHVSSSGFRLVHGDVCTGIDKIIFDTDGKGTGHGGAPASRRRGGSGGSGLFTFVMVVTVIGGLCGGWYYYVASPAQKAGALEACLAAGAFCSGLWALVVDAADTVMARMGVGLGAMRFGGGRGGGTYEPLDEEVRRNVCGACGGWGGVGGGRVCAGPAAGCRGHSVGRFHSTYDCSIDTTPATSASAHHLCIVTCSLLMHQTTPAFPFSTACQPSPFVITAVELFPAPGRGLRGGGTRLGASPPTTSSLSSPHLSSQPLPTNPPRHHLVCHPNRCQPPPLVIIAVELLPAPWRGPRGGGARPGAAPLAARKHGGRRRARGGQRGA